MLKRKKKKLKWRKRRALVKRPYYIDIKTTANYIEFSSRIYKPTQTKSF